ARAYITASELYGSIIQVASAARCASTEHWDHEGFHFSAGVRYGRCLGPGRIPRRLRRWLRWRRLRRWLRRRRRLRRRSWHWIGETRQLWRTRRVRWIRRRLRRIRRRI
ncbi:unnamed protein product, partial [Ixodes persulcatus]